MLVSMLFLKWLANLVDLSSICAIRASLQDTTAPLSVNWCPLDASVTTAFLA
jgi:hypothetical protein